MALQHKLIAFGLVHLHQIPANSVPFYWHLSQPITKAALFLFFFKKKKYFFVLSAEKRKLCTRVRVFQTRCRLHLGMNSVSNRPTFLEAHSRTITHKSVQHEERDLSHFGQFATRSNPRASGCRTPPVRRQREPKKTPQTDASLAIQTSRIPAGDQLRVLPLASLLTPHRSRGPTGETAPGSLSPQFCSIKVAFTSPKTEHFVASSQGKACEKKDEPPKRHIVATAGLLQRWLINGEERAKKSAVSTSLDRQKSSWSQRADSKRLKELRASHARRVFFLLILQRERGDQRARHDCCAHPTEQARPRRRRFVGVNRMKK